MKYWIPFYSIQDFNQVNVNKADGKLNSVGASRTIAMLTPDADIVTRTSCRMWTAAGGGRTRNAEQRQCRPVQLSVVEGQRLPSSAVLVNLLYWPFIWKKRKWTILPIWQRIESVVSRMLLLLGWASRGLLKVLYAWFIECCAINRPKLFCVKMSSLHTSLSIYSAPQEKLTSISEWWTLIECRSLLKATLLT